MLTLLHRPLRPKRLKWLQNAPPEESFLSFGLKWACAVLTVAASLVFGIWAPLSYQATIDSNKGNAAVRTSALEVASAAYAAVTVQATAIADVQTRMKAIGQLALLDFCLTQTALPPCSSVIDVYFGSGQTAFASLASYLGPTAASGPRGSAASSVSVSTLPSTTTESPPDSATSMTTAFPLPTTTTESPPGSETSVPTTSTLPSTTTESPPGSATSVATVPPLPSAPVGAPPRTTGLPAIYRTFPIFTPLSSSLALLARRSFTKLASSRATQKPRQRLSLIERHLKPHSTFELNTPYSTERLSSPYKEEDEVPHNPLVREAPKDIVASASKSSGKKETDPEDETKGKKASKMSSQPPHATLLIPGPIEFSDEVLGSMSHYSESHVGPAFVQTFSTVLTQLRSLFQTTSPDSQPFVISGSGTLGWDMVAANLAEPGEDVLVLHTGYFADSFADCFSTYGVNPTQLKAPIGERPQLPEIEAALKEKEYKLLTVTHVDTSTGVLSEIKDLASMVKRVSPETLVVVDGVCSVGCEEICFDEWGIDVVLTASQKAIGCPAGLCIMMCSGKAMEVFKNRKTPPGSYFASMKNWTPIMQNYEAGKASYFATPSPQLIHALQTALTQLLSLPLPQRFAQHRAISQKIKTHITSTLGLKQLASDPANQANGMTAIWLPEGVTPPEILPLLAKRGVVFAGGLHKQIAARYVRFGHMGVSVMDEGRGDVEKALEALGGAVEELGVKGKPSQGV
ncbi:hypothetical protein MMC25_002018 [Agyrium rufum]|nr:hypothetical protein [Agyrium rufum]